MGVAMPGGHHKAPWKRWDYRGGDLCAEMFSAAIKLAQPALEPAGRLLEVGCAEFDWLAVAEQSWPMMQLTGIDTRGCRGGHAADVRDRSLFGHWSFDTVVSVSAIEHVGLGHYGDPIDADGDILAMQNMRHWVKPDGWCYIDVPYAPVYHVQDTSHREYDNLALVCRLRVGLIAGGWYERWRGYATTSAPRVMHATYEAAAVTKQHPDELVCVCLWLQSSPGN